jgi:hypothetical protein
MSWDEIVGLCMAICMPWDLWVVEENQEKIPFLSIASSLKNETKATSIVLLLYSKIVKK